MFVNSRKRSGRTVFAAFLLSAVALLFAACQAKAPGATEAALVDQLKRRTIGGRDWTNPVADMPENVKIGAEHFQHHCAVCHGLDGHNTGVPFAGKMSPPVADLAEKGVQEFTDGQLKWIIQNGLRFTGMPGWSGILKDDEMWHVVRYIRHLPAKGSLGIPAVYKEEEEEHKALEQGQTPRTPSRPAEHQHQHQH
jgi:mono/diheme cytochrome c family protein